MSRKSEESCTSSLHSWTLSQATSRMATPNRNQASRPSSSGISSSAESSLAQRRKTSDEDKAMTRLERAEAISRLLEDRLKAKKATSERIERLEEKLNSVDRDIMATCDRLNSKMRKADEILNKRSNVSKKRSASPMDNDPNRTNLNSPSESVSNIHSKPKLSVHERLLNIERSVKKFDEIEKCLYRLSTQMDKCVATQNGGVGNLYGCQEINYAFKQTIADLERASAAITRLEVMPNVYSNGESVGGLKNRKEMEILRGQIDNFSKRLANSMSAYKDACDPSSECIICGTTGRSSASSFAVSSFPY